MKRNTTKVAIFKERSTCPIPYRPGPVQCVKCCTNCFVESSSNSNCDIDRIRNLECFDNLLLRDSSWPQPHYSIQYHTGQVAVLKGATRDLRRKGRHLTVYVVASIDDTDYEYLNRVLKFVGLPEAHQVHEGENFINSMLYKETVAISLLRQKSAVSPNGPGNFLNQMFKELIGLTIEHARKSQLLIVPISINKDNHSRSLFGLGSVCIQILEPFNPASFVPISNEPEKLTIHLWVDITMNTVILPTNIVAFILLYLDRENWVLFEELVSFMDWLRKISIDTGMQIGFTGKSSHCVELGIIILKDYIQTFPSYNGIFHKLRAKDINRLEWYAYPVSCILAYYGLICKAILSAHNQDRAHENIFDHRVDRVEPVRVMKDDVMTFCSNYATVVESEFPCRTPCNSIEDTISKTMSYMEKFGKFFVIEEPKILTRRERSWAFDSDSDDDYFKSNKNNPAMRTWVRLTTTKRRLDRMSLLTNAINAHVFSLFT